MVEIKNRYTGVVIYTHSGDTLSDAKLFGQKIQRAPIQINNLTWDVLITEHHMKIGCQVHTHQKWEDFTGDELAAMDNDAFEFAEKWRSIDQVQRAP